MTGATARAWVAAGATPAITLGRAQHAVRLQTALPVRHRASGGGAVLLGPWLLRALVRLPPGHPLARHGPVPLARWLGQVHLDWLRLAGARLHEGPPTDHWACFAGRGPGEVLVDGRKLVGIAQRWQRRGTLAWAATLLRPPPWPLLCDAFGRPADAAALTGGTIALEECLGRPVDGAACARTLHAALDAALRAGVR